ARANRFTSACSPIVYRDSYLEELVNNAFICEPVHNLVHREIMADDGTSFTSRRAPNESQSEFLTSSDNWFRPTTIRTGPDGALWIADMYRLVIEHPEWIPRDWQERLDLRSGADRGRIYRITRFDDKRFPASTHPLEGLPAEKLVAELNSSNGWRRDMAQEHLVRNNDPRTIKPLQEIARSSDSPLARLHALCTLDGMGQLGAEIVQPAMADPHAGVRRHAVRLARGVLTAEIQDAVIRLSETEEDPQVKLQIATLLGFIDSVPAGEALGRFASRHLGETYLYAASLSSIHEKNLTAVMQGALSGTDPPPGKLLEQLLAISAGLGNQEIVSSLIVDWTSTAPYAPWQIRAVTSTLASLKKKRPKQKDLLSAEALAGIRQMIQHLPDTVNNASLPVKDRREMISLLAYGEPDDAAIATLLEGLLTAQQPPGLQAAAVSAILQFHKDGASRLLRRWPSASPAIRSQIIGEILLVPRQTTELLDAIEQGIVPAGHLDTRQRQQLSQHANLAIARRAATILKFSPQSDRSKVLQAHQPIIQMEGDNGRGQVLYRKHCANCHRLEGVGFVVGPDLAALTDRSPQALLTAMLDPNRAVEAKFLEFTALTTDGRQTAGILTRETTTDLTLSAPEGKKFVILRKDIELLRSSGKSLMPVGFEKDISHQEFADLISYMRSQGPPPKSFPGNKPLVVHPNETDQVLELTAKTSRIYGPALRFEETYGNLGFWRGEQDRAEWTFELPRARKYEVWMDFACDQGTAGNKFQLRSSAGSLKGTVPSTGTWDTYQQKIIGTISLPAGTNDLTFQSDGEPGGYLIDLRAIRLKPAP
ncbi:MAG: c-type cytochrome, partial [Pirellulaceae bacterium]